jgi:hypothetical protein
MGQSDNVIKASAYKVVQPVCLGHFLSEPSSCDTPGTTRPPYNLAVIKDSGAQIYGLDGMRS